MLLWRGALALGNAAAAGRWVLLGAARGRRGADALVATAPLLGRSPASRSSVVLMALKTLELRARRDAFVVFFLGFFIDAHPLPLLAVAAGRGRDAGLGAGACSPRWCSRTCRSASRACAGRRRSPARTALLGAPVMALLFVLFPRIGPLWGVPQDGISTTRPVEQHEDGLGGRARAGRQHRAADALRRRAAAAAAMYFRGPVLSRFDGTEWKPLAPRRARRRAMPSSRPRRCASRGTPLRYEMTLEPLRLSTVPLLEATTDARRGSTATRVAARETCVWLADRADLRAAALRGRWPIRVSPRPDAQRGRRCATSLDLPPGYNPRTLAWAARASRATRACDADDPAPIAQALLQHIRTGGYSYTLAPGDYGSDAIDEFWLDRKRGLLRALRLGLRRGHARARRAGGGDRVGG